MARCTLFDLRRGLFTLSDEERALLQLRALPILAAELLHHPDSPPPRRATPRRRSDPRP